jgi:molybdopterin-guanine dinucleotide biosynthesis protein A
MGFNTLELDSLVLAGGESRRIGRPKAFLPLGHTTLLGVVVERLRPLFHRVIVVTREREALYGIDAEVLTDGRLERGPLVGLTRGLAASTAPWCFAVGCDMPFLQQKVIEHMASMLDGWDILVPVVGDHLQPLHAYYSRQCLPMAMQILDSGRASLQALLSVCHVRTINAYVLSRLDPELLSFKDVDTWDDYAEAKVRMGS